LTRNDRKPDGAPFGGVADGILNKVLKDALDQPDIRRDEGGILRNIAFNRQLAAVRFGSEFLSDIVRNFSN